MKAIIFDSGIGKRLGDFTKSHHKSMLTLNNGETILERQLRILIENGINTFVITTGPFKEQIEEVCRKYSTATFHFVENPLYNQTNYIYSMYLAIPFLDDDFLLLHGDLVFNTELISEMLQDDRKSLCLINKEKRLPEKDFKGRVIDDKLQEVSINIFDEDCYAFQPLYKLKEQDLQLWIEKVREFVKAGNVTVYAEEALNTILDKIDINIKSYSNHYIDEIDNMEDYNRVRNEIDLFEKSKIE